MSSPTRAGSPSKGKAAVVCQAQTSYKKKPGTLVLTKQALIWNQPGSTNPDGELNFPHNRLHALFMSKEGGAKVVMKVTVLDYAGGQNEESFNFTFTSGPSAVSDREHFKREISQVIAVNRSKSSNGGLPTAAPASAPASGPGSPAEFNGLPSPSAAAAAAATNLKNRGLSAPGTSNGAASVDRPDPTKDWQVRNRILKQNPDLNALHIDLVRSGMMPEEEFWEGREYLLMAEAVATAQVSGRSAQMVDPKPEQTDTGEIKIKLSQQLIKDIFEQYPIVAKVYNENVPEPLSEGEFWHRYFHSKLFERHRASGTSSLAGGSSQAKDDAIFDKYLEDPDDDLEPKHMKEDDVYRLLDLAATEEDHGESGSIKDFTMRAGSQKKALPLMRKFNEHSERLLAQALGEHASRDRTFLHGGDAGSRRYYDDIILEDLQGEETDEAIPLNVGDASDAYAGAAGSGPGDASEKDASKKRKLSLEQEYEIYEDTRQRLKSWQPDLGHFKFPGSSARLALASLQSNLATRLANASSSSHNKLFPETVLRAMVSCQASANEFLRHFWSAILPARQDDSSAAALATPQQKAGKAQRMITYLQKTQERVDTVIKDAGMQGTDPNSVKEALAPCMGAVNKALEYYHSRVKGKES